MTFQEFVHSVPGLIAAMAAFFGALASFYTARLAHLRYLAETRQQPVPADPDEPGKTKRRRPRRAPRGQLFWVGLGGFLLGFAATFAAAWLFSGWVRPAITITAPQQNAAIPVQIADTGSSRFDVAGTSSGVFGRADRRIFVLVHPQDPPATGWWIQPDVAVEPSGRWSGVAWIGNAQSPARPGHRLLIMTIVASNRDALPQGPDAVPWVADPAVLEPAASASVNAVIGGVADGPPCR